MSRWAHWSRGTEEKGKSFGSFLKEDIPNTGNPSAAMGPAERAASLGLQSNGKGGYIDPNTGQVVARTVNNELIFYDSNRATGGAIADGDGGAALTQAQPSWADPLTGMLTTPPSKAETPSEIAAIPDPTPATAPFGYNAFMKQKKMAAYQQNTVDPQPSRVTPDEMEQGDANQQQAFAAEESLGEARMGDALRRLQREKGVDPAGLQARMGEAPPSSIKANVEKARAQQQVQAQPTAPQVQQKDTQTPAQPKAVEAPAGKTLAQFQQGRRPKTGKARQAAWDAAQDPGNAPGVEKGESDRQSAHVDKMDPIDKALDKTSPEDESFNETLMKQREAKAITLAQQLENVKPDTSPVGRQELASAIAMMFGLRNSATNLSGGSEELFQKLAAVYPDMVNDSKKSDWYDSFVGQMTALRKNLNLGDDEIDDDWAVERTANRNRMDFIDPEDQQDFMQYTWDKLGDQVRKNYGSQLDSFNPADLTFARKSQLETMKKGIDKIVQEFGNMPEIMPGLINAYMDQLEQAGHLHRASLKQGDTEKGVEVQGKPVNQGPMKGFDIDYDDEGNPRLFSGGFLEGQNPRTSLSITADRNGQLGFDSHSFLMSPFFETGGKQDRYSIENKVSSLMGDAVESRELPEAQPENVPWRGISGGPSPANARGGGIPVQELSQMISDATGEDMNFRLGVRPKMKKDGTPSNQYEPDQFTDEDKTYWGEMLQSLIDERDDDDNPLFNFGDGPSFNGESMSAQDWVNRVFDMANSGVDGESKHENKFTMGLRSKLRQFRLMQMLQQARQKSPGDLAKVLAKMKYMAKKQGITGDLDKGGYTLYQ